MDPVEENHSLRADRFKQQVVRLDAYIQLAYDTNGDETIRIIHSGDYYSISVDQSGEVRLAGNAGAMSFNGGPALEGLGFKLRRLTLGFSSGDGGRFNYTGTFNFVMGTQLSVSGSIDVIELIKSCSGLLCIAARFLDGRDAQIERELQQYVD